MVKLTLKAARVNAGFTQKDVAKRLNISNKTVCSWETGATVPNIEQVEGLCDLYNVSYDNLIFYPAIRLKRIKKGGHHERDGQDRAEETH